jgi:hypothetical protein
LLKFGKRFYVIHDKGYGLGFQVAEQQILDWDLLFFFHYVSPIHFKIMLNDGVMDLARLIQKLRITFVVLYDTCIGHNS